MTDEAARALEARKPIIKRILARRGRDRHGVSRTWREWMSPRLDATPQLPGMRVVSTIVAGDTATYAPGRRAGRYKTEAEVRVLADAEAGDVVRVSYRGVSVVVCIGGWIWRRSVALVRPWVNGREDHSGSPMVLESKTTCELVQPAWSV